MTDDATTRCTVTGPAADIAKFRERVFTIKNEKPHLDFDKIIPAPPILREVENSGINEAAAALIVERTYRYCPEREILIDVSHSITKIEDVREELNMPNGSIAALATAYFAKYPESEAQRRLRLLASIETGYSSGRYWNLTNWETESNAYDCEVMREDPLEFIFVTEWLFPKPVFVKLSKRFRSLHFKCVTYGPVECGQGYFNPPKGEAKWEFCQETDELYEQVFGQKPDHEQADD